MPYFHGIWITLLCVWSQRCLWEADPTDCYRKSLLSFGLALQWGTSGILCIFKLHLFHMAEITIFKKLFKVLFKLKQGTFANPVKSFSYFFFNKPMFRLSWKFCLDSKYVCHNVVCLWTNELLRFLSQDCLLWVFAITRYYCGIKDYGSDKVSLFPNFIPTSISKPGKVGFLECRSHVE